MFFVLFFFFFFFQAEDGIRDHCVTGVQTCALPILSAGSPPRIHRPRSTPPTGRPACTSSGQARSEERRVGKSVDLGGRRIIKKKKKKTKGKKMNNENKHSQKRRRAI